MQLYILQDSILVEYESDGTINNNVLVYESPTKNSKSDMWVKVTHYIIKLTKYLTLKKIYLKYMVHVSNFINMYVLCFTHIEVNECH